MISKDGIAFEDSVGHNGYTLGRDAAGVLWQRWALRQGDGTTDFRTVHGPRQRRAMRKQLCQVCGGPSDENEQGRLYLLEDYRGVENWPEREVTTHPPLCRPCVPLAVQLCPHLRGKVAAVRARRVSGDGVHGMVYQRGENGAPVESTVKVVFHGDWRMKWMLGGQLAATLEDVTVVDLDDLLVGPAVREAADA
ncbi:hypothetical protein [Streptomyces sp. 11x1]|uniref:hypothetical protein n=1 Tax=Streptomyces sp. 11x1 TaxID=3038642 RepID=UPI00292D95AB|nr:hypothetical protein [Streptomyces sp. 11x1]WNZ14953.1 hypothetical protein P8T65_46805 [Streptomyces sp. 11x1]